MLYISDDVRRISKDFVEFWFVVKEIRTDWNEEIETFIKGSNKTG